MIRHLSILSIFLIAGAEACHPRFEKELRYLDLYLGIQPAHKGNFLMKEPKSFATYVEKSSDLNCEFDKPCSWRNAPSDGLLDTSEYWLFNKTDDKMFPPQIEHGQRLTPPGTHFAVAGNTTSSAESAVLLSAPVACQKGQGSFIFNYWVYNQAKVEVVIVKSIRRRGHLQVLLRPAMTCHMMRPGDEACKIAIPAIDEPFRIGVRAFNLKDNVVGSMVLVNNFQYRAAVCGESPFPSLFNSIALNPVIPPTPLLNLAAADCKDAVRSCSWSNAEESLPSEWRVATTTERWGEVLEARAHSPKPNGTFLFLAADQLTAKPYATLRSPLIPCTKTTTTLSMKYWLRTGTQVEVCSVDADGVVLSCAYLSEDDSPGPIQIDLDPYFKPFRFTIEMIAFDPTAPGVVVIEDIEFTSGLLCSEQPPPVATTIDPLKISSLFAAQPSPSLSIPYSLALDCDFTADYCTQWVSDDGKLQYGVAPIDNAQFPMPRQIKGNVGLVTLRGADSSIVRSREVPCAYNAHITLGYMRSEHASVRLCALGRCVEGGERVAAISLPVSSTTPFEVTIESNSTKNAIVVISEIEVQGEVCPLKTAEQVSCEKLKCSFNDDLCRYESGVYHAGDTPLEWKNDALSVSLDEKSPRSVLLSPRFDLPAPSLLNIKITQSTFGSRVLLCPDPTADPTACHQLLGPRVLLDSPNDKHIAFPIDEGVHRFALILLHEHAAQFGPAHFRISDIDIRTAEDFQMCF